MRGWEPRKNSSPGLRIEDLNANTINKRCRKERHGSSESWVRRCPASVFRRPWRPWRTIDGTVRGPPLKRRCARALRRSVRGAIAVSDRSNVALRSLCGDFCQNSSEPRCGRSLRPIVFSTLVSYRAGRCWRTWVSSNVAVRRVC